ncbi:MAG: carbonic anhydrase [Myxococcaceae bacterium]
MKTALLLLALVAVSPLTGCKHADAHHPHWTYEGAEGPSAWAGLSPEFAACGAGHAQSPVDLSGAAPTDLTALAPAWKPSKLSLTHNGHTVQQTAEPGSTLELGGKTFQLAQLHFHHPSEHAVDGKRFPLEVHLVHKGPDGELAVVGVFFEEGAESAALAPIVAALPQERGATASSDAPVDPSGFLPQDKAYFSYAGSLTTPPCSEGVKWQVFKAPASASASQLEAFAKLFENNARPLMPLDGRAVAVDSTP